MVMGHEFSGVVVDAGPSVSGFAAEDEVIVSPIQACGECPNCRAGLTNICTNRHVLGVDEVVLQARSRERERGAGEGGAHRDFGGLLVAYLAHHHDVRVLPQE